jgi:hypothetical protein
MGLWPQLQATQTLVVIGPRSRSRSLSSGARSRDPLAHLSGTTTEIDSIFKQPRGCAPAIPRREAPEVLLETFAHKTEGAGNAGCPPHPQPRVRSLSEAHECSHHGHTGNHPAFPAQWFYGLFRALPGDEFVLSPSLADYGSSNPVELDFASASLTPATGARTTRLHRPLKRRSSCTPLTAHEVHLALRLPLRA